MSEICYKITKTTDYSVRDCKEYDVNLTMLPDGHMFGSEDIEDIFYTDTLENAIETLEISNCKDGHYNIVVPCFVDNLPFILELKLTPSFNSRICFLAINSASSKAALIASTSLNCTGTSPVDNNLYLLFDGKFKPLDSG